MTELLRERIEADIETWIAPYEQAVKNAVLYATYEGQVIASKVPDLAARIAAAEKVLDRVYGRPRQAVDVDIEPPGRRHFDTETFQDPEVQRASHELLAAAGRARSRALNSEKKRLS